MTYSRDTFQTGNAGLLSKGDEFEFKLYGEEGNYGAFTFHSHTVHDKGEWITVYGGDPIKKDHAHRRQWHSLNVDRVRAEAKPIRPTWRSKRP